MTHDGDFPQVQHPGPPDQPEVLRDHLGNPFPKRDGLWETAGGKEYYSGPQPGFPLQEGYYFTLVRLFTIRVILLS